MSSLMSGNNNSSGIFEVSCDFRTANFSNFAGIISSSDARIKNFGSGSASQISFSSSLSIFSKFTAASDNDEKYFPKRCFKSSVNRSADSSLKIARIFELS